MSRYYFDMIDGVTISDDEGRDIDGGDAEVREEALADARDLIANAAASGIDITARRFEVRDDLGTQVMTVEFADALTPEESLNTAMPLTNDESFQLARAIETDNDA